MILDVVYNHLGPGTEAFEAFGPYLTGRHGTPWGDAINFDDRDCGGVREWAIQNACMWVRDYRIDGLRVDAVHAIHDEGARHVLAELCARVAEAGGGAALTIAESDLNDPMVVRGRDAGGWGFDAQWSDDFHHALHARLTGERDGYYADYGALADLAAASARPFVYDGRYSSFRRRRHGAPADGVPARSFVVCAQNHDQVGNRALGERPPLATRRLAAMWVLLSPWTPMIFMGEEHGETRPFLFFTDHIDPSIADATREGRRHEFKEFAGFEDAIPDPQDPGHLRALGHRPGGRGSGGARALPGADRAAPGDAARRAAGALRRGRGVDRGPSRPRRGGRQLLGRDDGGGRGRTGRGAGDRRRGGARGRAAPAACPQRGGGPLMRVWPGWPFPLGATWDGGGTNFSLFSENATAVELCLFDENDQETRDTPHRGDRLQLARLPARTSAPGSATATACTAPGRPSGGTASTPSSS